MGHDLGMKSRVVAPVEQLWGVHEWFGVKIQCQGNLTSRFVGLWASVGHRFVGFFGGGNR